MTAFSVGFIFIMVFTVLVGIGAMILISFDPQPSDFDSTDHASVKQGRIDCVRRINTSTIETVDVTGMIQRWTRASDETQ